MKPMLICNTAIEVCKEFYALDDWENVILLFWCIGHSKYDARVNSFFGQINDQDISFNIFGFRPLQEFKKNERNFID